VASLGSKQRPTTIERGGWTVDCVNWRWSTPPERD
jgi:hypothetical protein